jgi:hypothetical protein
LATPTIGFSKSPSPNPTARSIARFGERGIPWVISRERRLKDMGAPEAAGWLEREAGHRRLSLWV